MTSLASMLKKIFNKKTPEPEPAQLRLMEPEPPSALDTLQASIDVYRNWAFRHPGQYITRLISVMSSAICQQIQTMRRLTTLPQTLRSLVMNLISTLDAMRKVLDQCDNNPMIQMEMTEWIRRVLDVTMSIQKEMDAANTLSIFAETRTLDALSRR